VTQLRELFEDAAGSPPSSPYTANSIYAAGRRRRLRSNTARAATGVLAIAAVGGTAYAAVQPYWVGGTAADQGTTTYVVSIAVDGDHFYATLQDCPTEPSSDPTSDPTAGPTPTAVGSSTSPGAGGSQSGATEPYAGTIVSTGPGTANPSSTNPTSTNPTDGSTGNPSSDAGGCRFRDIESTDRGRTWKTKRTGAITVPRPGVLAVDEQRATDLTGVGRVSVDRGVTWHTIVRQNTPTAAVPDGGWATTYPAEHDANPVVLGVDPRTGIARPLANQPPFQVIESGDAIQTGAIVVYGLPSDTVPQRYAISRDGGRTWSAHTLPTVDRSTLPLVYTTDGVHLYAISDRNGDRVIRYLVSGDGNTWSPQRTVPGDMVVGWYVAPDGGVVLATADGPRTSFWITHDGTHFEPFTGMHGLPASTVVSITRNGDGTYLARPGGGSRAFYVSPDGVSWQRVRIR
jgi:hypothetical protein